MREIKDEKDRWRDVDMKKEVKITIKMKMKVEMEMGIDIRRDGCTTQLSPLHLQGIRISLVSSCTVVSLHSVVHCSNLGSKVNSHLIFAVNVDTSAWNWKD